MRDKAKNLVESRRFEIIIESLIALYVVVYILSNLRIHSPILEYVEYSFIFIFAIEYILKAYAFRTKHIFSIWGAIDLIALYPFTSAIRIIRVLRILRTLQAFERLSLALKAIKNELFALLTTTLVILFLAAALLFEFEHTAQPEKFRSIIDSFWWSIVTVTTVGYGDLYPITSGGRIVAACLQLFSIILIALPTALVANAFNKTSKEPNRIKGKRY